MDPLILFKKEWFKYPEWWFETKMETDLYLTETYGHWLDENMMDHSWDWTKDTLMAWVLLYDQLPRHVARVSPKNVVYPYLHKAIGLVKLVIEDGFDSIFPLHHFNGNEFGFLMLPLRHSYDCKLTYTAMKHTWIKIEQDKAHGNHKDVEQLKPFLIATYKRCPMLPMDLNDQYTYKDYFQVFPALETTPNTPFQWEKHQSVISYTPELLFEGEDQPTDDRWVYGWKLPTTDGTLLVSLSGGVDSMVLLWILSKRYTHVPIVAVYINYCNRGDEEEDFIRDWCQHLNITLYVRRIREIQRIPAMTFELRETYETYTRNVRFHTYHQANHAENTTSSLPLVAMGHNQDDCFENILTNICQKQKYENLKGMTSHIESNGVQFWRPMLSISKHCIYHFAQKHQIPYVRDSTPSWSCRGKIRDIVRPTLEQYHPAMIPAFFHLSQTLTELTQYIEHFSKNICDRIQTDTQTLTVGLTDYPSSIWTSSRIWQYVFQTHWSFCPSHKSIAHLCDSMRLLFDPSKHKTQLNVLMKKNYSLLVSKTDTHITITFVPPPHPHPS